MKKGNLFLLKDLVSDYPDTKSFSISRVKELQPFFKWVGGKGSMIKNIEYHISEFTENTVYWEPFLGGGSLFWYLRAKYGNGFHANLSDLNPIIVNAYKSLRDNPKKLFELYVLLASKHSKGFYYRIREIDRNDLSLTDIESAARFLYLNRACYNGLWRVNKKGQNNSPYGHSSKITVHNLNFFLLCSDALRNTNIECTSYNSIKPNSGDFVYFDPPYIPISATANFTSYNSEGFGWVEQVELKEYCDTLYHGGVNWVVSNSTSEAATNLWDEYQQYRYSISRRINNNPSGRKPEENELIVISRRK